MPINWNLIWSDDFTVDQTTFANTYTLGGVPPLPAIGPTNGPTGGPGVVTVTANPFFGLQNEGHGNPVTGFIPGPQQSAFRVTGIWKLLPGVSQTMMIFNGFESNSIFALWSDPHADNKIKIQLAILNFGDPARFFVCQDPMQTGVPLAFDVQGKLSTMVGSVPNNDGWLKVILNGSTVVDLSNVLVWFGIHTADGWGNLSVRPQGNFGSLRVYNEATIVPPTSPEPTFVNSVPSCCDDATKALQAAVQSAQLGTFWIPSCTGGGVVPSAADLTLPEVWDY